MNVSFVHQVPSLDLLLAACPALYSYHFSEKTHEKPESLVFSNNFLRFCMLFLGMLSGIYSAVLHQEPSLFG